MVAWTVVQLDVYWVEKTELKTVALWGQTLAARWAHHWVVHLAAL